MAPLTYHDLLPLEDYVGRRREFFDAHRRYIDRCRRVRIGPSLTLIFENRQTLWYRVQEVIRIARLAERHEVEQELNLYNRLLPGRDLLQAALLIDIDETRFGEQMQAWRHLQGEHLRLCLGERAVAATLVTSRPEDRCSGTAHWVQFALGAKERRLLANVRTPAQFIFDDGAYCHSSAMSPELRQSLADDLLPTQSIAA